MEIISVTPLIVEIPVRREVMITSSLGTHSVSRVALVRMETDAGIGGVGEATVTAVWSGETAEGAYYLIRDHLGPAVVGLDPREPRALLEAMDRVVWANPFAKSALEMAAWDIAGKAAGKPVHELLGGACRGLALPIRFSLAARSPEETATAAIERVAWGHKTMKVKVGIDPKEDVARVRAVRDAIGPDILLTVDANGGWSEAQAVWALGELADCNLLLAEQPTPRDDLVAMAVVRGMTATPIMADEGVFTFSDAERALEAEACDILAIYPGKNGGLLRSRQIAELAAAAEVSCAIGSNLETDIATAAMCHLSVATPNVAAERYHGDILGPLYQAERIVRNPLRIEGGFAHCPAGPGLGIDVDWGRVETLSLAP